MLDQLLVAIAAGEVTLSSDGATLRNDQGEILARRVVGFASDVAHFSTGPEPIDPGYHQQCDGLVERTISNQLVHICQGGLWDGLGTS